MLDAFAEVVDDPAQTTRLRGRLMAGQTRYDLSNGFNTIIKVITLRPIDMAKDMQQLTYLKGCIEKLDVPFVETTCWDVIEDWNAVRSLTEVMSGELAQAVLLSIFCDPDVLKVGQASKYPRGKPNIEVSEKSETFSPSPGRLWSWRN